MTMLLSFWGHTQFQEAAISIIELSTILEFITELEFDFTHCLIHRIFIIGSTFILTFVVILLSVPSPVTSQYLYSYGCPVRLLSYTKLTL